MGSLQLWTPVGSIISDTMQNFVLSSFLAVATSASVLHAPSGLATWPSVGGYGYAISQPHPGFAGSFQSRTQFHSGYGKRSADPSYGATLTLQNHNNLFGHQLSSGYGISQAHPGFSGSSSTFPGSTLDSFFLTALDTARGVLTPLSSLLPLDSLPGLPLVDTDTDPPVTAAMDTPLARGVLMLPM